VTVATSILRIPAADGFELGATLFGDSVSDRGVVLIVPAAGVLRRIYADYAYFLAGKGFAAITWDWRGIGDSRPRSLRGFAARMRDWGALDLPGVIDWARSNLSSRVCAVAHSFGGQAIGLAPNGAALERIVTVGSQIGYWRLWPVPTRYQHALLWYLVLPAVTRLVGWFPAKYFRLGEDLPAGVALEWAGWCRSPDYLGDFSGHAAIRAPLLAICFSDDYYAPRPAFEWLHERYGSHTKLLRWITPREAGADYVGHFGFFRRNLVPALWEETASWLAPFPSK
jgi:predicted alpha/beta hydrolase